MAVWVCDFVLVPPKTFLFLELKALNCDIADPEDSPLLSQAKY